MKNNLYYTPTIEELSINQEVYLLDTGNYKAEFTKNDIYPMNVNITQLTDYPTIWVKTKGTEIGHKLYEVYPEQIGLKYLDQSDIESLRWKLDIVSKSPFTGKELKTYTLNIISGFNTGTYWTLKATDLTYEISSNTYSSYKTHNQNIEVIIKNKSELIKLMQQLNIK